MNRIWPLFTDSERALNTIWPNASTLFMLSIHRLPAVSGIDRSVLRCRVLTSELQDTRLVRAYGNIETPKVPT